MPRRLLAFLPFCLLAVVAGGCSRLHAKTTPQAPPLDVPAPPPRIVETVEPQPPVTIVETPAPPAAAPPAPARPRPPGPAPAARTDKPEPTKPEPPAGLDVPAPEPPRAATGTLQTAPPQREAELEKTIRELLGRAAANLKRVDYGRLNADAKSQYNQSKRFAEQAEEALRAKNLLYAHNLADKAATLAAQLAGR